MRTRRRRTKYTWFPAIGTTWNEVNPTATIFNTLDVVPAERDDWAVGFHPLTYDLTEFAEPGVQASLSDFVQGQEWVNERIVGDIRAQIIAPSRITSFSDNSDWAQVKVDAGIMVARADDDNQALIDLFEDEFVPDLASNVQNPWMFRRTWVLGNPHYSGLTTTSPFGSVPSYNFANACGNMWDGCHIDVKSKRRIQREHRLWLVMSSRGWSPEAITNVPETSITPSPQLSYTVDLRILGTMRKARSTKVF